MTLDVDIDLDIFNGYYHLDGEYEDLFDIHHAYSTLILNIYNIEYSTMISDNYYIYHLPMSMSFGYHYQIF